ncbi:MAG TPA: Holliday junction branch migration protein RuvA [Candidatus Monoglobus merdigallinarum]|uniref:Holliday junction branch migration complex subunit RuvA n=1 Tax=Candidatus Monoglobus merdigallinarum TaxID=2838698 RepID=A0A9D1PP84_9FIRM|nr:Holliday junction branch migration protein RuvA [Candidatus Monoglobus merdigallinarum]
MFYYIEGKLALKTDSYAVIDCGGVGYRIFSTGTTLASLGESGSHARLYTYLNIKNSADTLTIYGFSTIEEKNLFEMILGVSGIGAKTAAALLSNVSPSKFALCVVTDDAKYLSDKTPGLGPKGAKRLILELKDKFKDVYIEDAAVTETFTAAADEDSEALAALMALGYSRDEAAHALKGAAGSTEDMIKSALKNLI